MGHWCRSLQSMFVFKQTTPTDVHSRERREYKVFRSLIDSVHGLEERLVSADELILVAELVRILCPLVGLIFYHFGS